jgi:site-specific DNA-adenine methylase
VPLFEPVADRLAGDVAIVACQFDIIDSAGPGDLIYLDPPYYEGHREIASEYGIGRFTEDDRSRMVQLAKSASLRGARVVGSDIDSPYTRTLYESAGFSCESVSFVYCIGGHQKTRTISSELIYHNKL